MPDAVATKHPPMATAVSHPCDDVSLESALEGGRLGLLKPILVGPPEWVLDLTRLASCAVGVLVAAADRASLAAAVS